MRPVEELVQITAEIRKVLEDPLIAASAASLEKLTVAADEIGKASSGSWRGYHAYVYYSDLEAPPPGVHFSEEWGLIDNTITGRRSGYKGWTEFDPNVVEKAILDRADHVKITEIKNFAEQVADKARYWQEQGISILSSYTMDSPDSFLERIIEEVRELTCMTPFQVTEAWSPKGQFMTRDTVVIGQGTRVPPHLKVKSQAVSIQQTFSVCQLLAMKFEICSAHISRRGERKVAESRIGTNVFIGHGRSPLWRELKDFIQDRIRLPADEFNRVPVAGITNQARLIQMLDSAALAFIIMTAEDEMADAKVQARMNVVHEVGLFQGRLGFTKAIVLLEDGCEEFSNIHGIGQIRFPKHNIKACFEEVRAVIEREGLIPS